MNRCLSRLPVVGPRLLPPAGLLLAVAVAASACSADSAPPLTPATQPVRVRPTTTDATTTPPAATRPAVDPVAVAALIVELGADDFATRERATRKLIDLGEPVLAAVEQASQTSPDPEVRNRAAEILQAIRLAGVPTLEQFEQQQVDPGKVESAKLEKFIQEMNRRKDADFLANPPQGSPESARMWTWIQKATEELTRRGYHVGKDGAWLRPDKTVVPLR